MERRLAAIFSADVQGYSRLMGDDEVATVQTLTAYREVLTHLIEAHRGRVVDAPGDNMLAEFTSVVDAVQGAVEIQRELASRNADLPASRQMHFRIGINLGDVLVDGAYIYGDGVNIAARMESLAEGGGICISGTAYDQVKTKLALAYVSLGEHTVKNIAEPVRVYRVRHEAELDVPITTHEIKVRPKRWQIAALISLVLFLVGVAGTATWYFFLRPMPLNTTEIATAQKNATVLEKPAIAVMPFSNLSGNEEQAYFADGLSDDLLTALSKISGLLVIARHSTFAYKDTTPDVRQVGRELDVSYILEGSVRRAGEQIRINAQLIDANTGHHLWAERYDGHMRDIFALQDTITRKIVAALAVQLTENETEQMAHAGTDNVAAYDAYLQGWEYVLRLTPDDFAKAVPYFETAIELDPDYGKAHAARAWTYWYSSELAWHQHLGVSSFEARLRGRTYLQEAMRNPTLLAYQLAAFMDVLQRRHTVAIAEAEHAIALDPNDDGAHRTMAWVLIMGGRPEEALPFAKRALRLNPHHRGPALYVLGLAHFAKGQLEEAVRVLERARTLNPAVGAWAELLAATYAHLGRDEEARTAFAVVRKTWEVAPTLLTIMYFWPFKDLEPANRLASGLLQAGLPGESGGFYHVFEQDKLIGAEIRELVFGRTVTGHTPWMGRPHRIERTTDGQATCLGCRGLGVADRGRSWIEGDMLCDQWQQSVQGHKVCQIVFRNPTGSPALKDEYLSITDIGIYPWSPVQER